MVRSFCIGCVCVNPEPLLVHKFQPRPQSIPFSLKKNRPGEEARSTRGASAHGDEFQKARPIILILILTGTFPWLMTKKMS